MISKTFRLVNNNISIDYNSILGIIHNNLNQSKIIVRRSNQHSILEKLFFTKDLLPNTFKPNCLTVFINHQCNLSCSYCYVPKEKNIPTGNIKLSAIQSAAEFVAHNCKESNLPFILGFHGGNEPLLNKNMIIDIINSCRKVADKYELSLFSFCTTNGVLEPETALWARDNFDGITLSWDGPKEIHDKHRRSLKNQPTFEAVRRTAEILSSTKQLTIRVTITRDSVNNLYEITKFFHDLGLMNLHVFPVFPNGKGILDDDLKVDQETFVFNFLIARKWAKDKGMTLLYAGSRIEDFHDKFCTINQNNLTITPDGFISTCFMGTHNYKNENDMYMFGHYDDISDELVIDWNKLGSIYKIIAQPNKECENCFNYYHCSKNCLFNCPLLSSYKECNLNCKIEKWIGIANILETAGIELNINSPQECINFFNNFNITTV